MTTPITKTQVLTRGKNVLFAALGFFAALGVLSVTHLGPAQAQGPGVNLAALVAQVSALTTQVSALKAQVAALQIKTAPLSVSGTPGTFPATLSITGVNVQIVSGSGYTDDGTRGEIPNVTTLTGLGNLIIGYNASGNTLGAGDVRTGSHNLILGDQNNYSSFGGLVAGIDNASTNIYASVSGGYGNTASGQYASVSGGGNLTQSTNYGWTGGAFHTP